MWSNAVKIVVLAAVWSNAVKIVVLAASALVARAASAHRIILEKSLVLD